MLEFAAEHRLVLDGQIAALLGISVPAAVARCRALAAAGYISRRHLLHGRPACVQITRRGLRAIGNTTAPPGLDLSCYDHDVGTAWLWLAAHAGAFGELRAVIGERRMRSHDAIWERQETAPGAARALESPHGVRLGGTGAGGRLRLHYPDLTLVTRQGTGVAIEYELSDKGRTSRERILCAYAADHRIAAVLYLVERRPLGRLIESSARKLGIEELVRVQLASLRPPGAERGGRGAGLERAGSRARVERDR